MEFFMCLLVGVLVGVGAFCILQPNIMRIIIGLIILSNAANLVIFVASGIRDRVSPIIPKHEEFLDLSAADPVPQALILTAIIIGFGLMAYFLVLCREFYKDRGEDNLTSGSFE